MPLFTPYGFRGASGFVDPRSISNLVAWYRSDLGVSLSGSDVTTWADQSGNGHDLTEATNRPVYNATSGANSLPGITFDGTNDKLACSNFTSVPQPIYTIAVFKLLSTPVNSAVISGSNAVDTSRLISYATTASIGMSVWSTGGDFNNHIATTEITNFHIWETLLNGASSSIRRDNGTADTTGDVGTGAMTAVLLGTLGTGGEFTSFVISEVIIYGANITGTNQTNLRNYLNARYGIAV